MNEKMNLLKEAISDAVYDKPQRVVVIVVAGAAAIYYGTRAYYKNKAAK